MIDSETYSCPICNRKHTSDKMNWHHLLPSINNNERSEPRIYICKTCHSVIHFCHTNVELYNNYNTLEKLLESNDIIKIVNLYKYKADNITIKIKNIKKMLKTA